MILTLQNFDFFLECQVRLVNRFCGSKMLFPKLTGPNPHVYAYILTAKYIPLAFKAPYYHLSKRTETLEIGPHPS